MTYSESHCLSVETSLSNTAILQTPISVILILLLCANPIESHRTVNSSNHRSVHYIKARL